jgi:hypothetical protein
MGSAAPARAAGCSGGSRATPLAALAPGAVLQRANAVVERRLEQLMTA